VRPLRHLWIIAILIGLGCGDTLIEPVQEEPVHQIFPSVILCKEDEVWVSNPIKLSSFDSRYYRNEYIFLPEEEGIAYAYRLVAEDGDVIGASHGRVIYLKSIRVEDSSGDRAIQHRLVFVEELPEPDPFEARYPATLVIETSRMMILKGTFFFKIER